MKTRNVNFNQLLQEGHILQVTKEDARKGNKKYKNQESTQVDESSPSIMETSGDDISSSMLEEVPYPLRSTFY